MAEFFCVLLMIGGGWLIYEIIKGRAPQSSSAGADARSYATFKDRSTIIIKERHYSLIEAIEVVAAREVNISYTPDKYIYTGATVGGIHTGGVSKIEGGYSARSGSKTGDYYLSFKYGKYNEYNDMRWSSKYISCIVLTKKDYELAKKDKILNRFIPNDKQKENAFYGIGNNLTREQADTALSIITLSKAEADYVRNWLGNNTNS